MLSHHLRLFFSNVSQGQNTLNVNSVWQTCIDIAKARQELNDCLKAARMSSITQNFESDNDLFNFAPGNSLYYKLMEWL